MRLKDKVAIVVGAGQSPGEGVGNGRATALTFAREGAKVLCVDYNLGSAEETVDMIKKGQGTATAIKADVTKESDIKAFVADAVKRWGRVDILHNNVGVSISGGDAELLGEGDHGRLRRLVGDVRVGGDRRHRGDVDDGAAVLRAHDRDHLLGGENAALQIDGDDAVERLLGDLQQFGVAAGQADADIVVQHVDPAPARLRLRDHRLDVGGFRDVGPEGHGGALLPRDHCGGFLCRFQMMVDTKHFRALACKGQRCGAAVAHALAGALAGADDDRNLVLQAHLSSLPGSGTAAVPLCNKARCRSSWWRARAPRRNRRRW